MIDDNELERAVRMVLSCGLATGNADTFTDLMLEVLDQYKELLEKYLALRAVHNNVRIIDEYKDKLC